MGSVNSKVFGVQLQGLDVVPVAVECSIFEGLPGVTVMGLPEAGGAECAARVRCAIQSSGFEWPRGRVVVNLAPNSIRKSGTGYDLPVAVAILAATGQIQLPRVEACVGELSLGGDVLPVRGSERFALWAEGEGKGILMSDGSDNRVESPAAFGISSLSELRRGVERPIAKRRDDAAQEVGFVDFADVEGHAIAKRAAQIAAVGNLGILFIGSATIAAGSLARRVWTILPRLGREDCRSREALYSIAGAAIGNLPSADSAHMRVVGPETTLAGLVGGGDPILPGEAILAHEGALLLDNVANFSPRAVVALGMAAAEGCVKLTRSGAACSMPSRFLPVGVAASCPCGHFGDARHECRCSANHIRLYQGQMRSEGYARLFPIAVQVADGMGAGMDVVSSAQLRAEVEEGRDFRRVREQAGDVLLLDWCTPGARDMLLSESYGLGDTATEGVLGVARAIADLDLSELVTKTHVMEACALRWV